MGQIKHNQLPHTAALLDYFYLMNGAYPEKGSLKLVGDRHKLTHDQRTVLYRGICSREMALQRREKIVKELPEVLIIDGYNVLFTLLNYRLGRFVFIGTDNICRDAGESFGKISNKTLFNECINLLVKFLNWKIKKLFIYLDSPVSHSAAHRQTLEIKLAEAPFTSHIALTQSADKSILAHNTGCIATSDSGIIDACKNPVLDLPRYILTCYFNANLPDLSQLVDEDRDTLI